MRTPLSLAISFSLLGLAGNACAVATLDPVLQQKLSSLGPHEVIVTFDDRRQMDRLLTVSPTAKLLDELPMAGALLTSVQVQQVANWEGVESVYFNAPLKYFNYEAGEETGGHDVHDFVGLKGDGVTIAILDSGIDANHPDLAFGSKVVQNVKVVTDLGAAGASAVIENQQNTDSSSGHGTHCAGIAAGSGAASLTDSRRPRYYAGIAPEATLVGLGTGEGTSILHALMGIDWILRNQERYSIDVVNNSWGSSVYVYEPNNPVNQATYEMYRRGMVVAFAAGNDGPGDDTLNPYAIVPWAINVGNAVTATRALNNSSSRGLAGDFYKHIDVVAPGTSIRSTRAPGTVFGTTGPVVDAENPLYTAYYSALTGTSMASPFVAGAAALLLEANPELSPDQIEQILMQTADPMLDPATGQPYPYHRVGGGFINVMRAVDVASKTVGRRNEFLAGVTAWSSQGQWEKLTDGNGKLAYGGKWTTTANAGATEGSYRSATVSRKEVPRVRAAFAGKAFQLEYPRDRNGGLADLYVDGVFKGHLSFYAATPDRNRFALNGMDHGLHHIELRGVKDRIYFDGGLIDGPVFAVNTTQSTQTTRFSGTMGPSAENLMVHEYPLEIDSNVISVKAQLGWTGGVDLDLYLLGPDGSQIASAASLANPEAFEFPVTVPGTYTLQVKGYATLVALYNLDATLTRVQVTATP
jgi:serine protease AprX